MRVGSHIEHQPVGILHVKPKKKFLVIRKSATPMLINESLDEDRRTLREVQEAGGEYYGVKFWRPGPPEDQFPCPD